MVGASKGGAAGKCWVSSYISSKKPSDRKKRLDVIVCEQGLAPNLAKAHALILAGQLEVKDPTSGRLVPSHLCKPGHLFVPPLHIRLKEQSKYVSRGGDKLVQALKHWSLDVNGNVCLDIGASTGGFTDCLLQHGARFVYALDVGHGQLHPKIRGNPSVRVYEREHFLKWDFPWIDPSLRDD